MGNVIKRLPNSGYAVRHRSPKPLRASHTRQALSDIAKSSKMLDISSIMIAIYSTGKDRNGHSC